MNKLIYAKAYATLPDDTVRFRLGLPKKDMVLTRLLNLKSMYEKGINLKTNQHIENHLTHEEYEEKLFKRLNITSYTQNPAVTYAQSFLTIISELPEQNMKTLTLMLHKAREFNLNTAYQASKLITASMTLEERLYIIQAVAGLATEQRELLTGTNDKEIVHLQLVNTTDAEEPNEKAGNPSNNYYHCYATDYGHYKRSAKDQKIGFLYGYMEGLSNFSINPFFLIYYGSDYYGGYEYAKNNPGQSGETKTIQRLINDAKRNFGNNDFTLLDKDKKLKTQLTATLNVINYFTKQAKSGLAYFNDETINMLIQLEETSARTLENLSVVPEFQELFT
ncbi:MAG: hypothetical protein V4544_06985 [Pseudomonadota bacterium]